MKLKSLLALGLACLLRVSNWRVDSRNRLNRRGPLVPAGYRCRNYSQANPAANHLANGIEAGKADTQFQATSGAGLHQFCATRLRGRVHGRWSPPGLKSGLRRWLIGANVASAVSP